MREIWKAMHITKPLLADYSLYSAIGVFLLLLFGFYFLEKERKIK